MKQVFEQVRLPGGITVANRLVRSATWEGVAETDGSMPPQAWPIYEDLATGGVGLLITGFTSVSQDDVYIAEPMRLSADALVPQYASLVDTIHAHGCPTMPQLALGGFYRRLSAQNAELIEADGMSLQEIQQVVSLFAPLRGGRNRRALTACRFTRPTSFS